jgi:regulator of cell morphogenesis and NO signaling
MIVTANMKMAEVIIQNHHLLSIINRFGIQLGFGEKSIEQVCEQNNIPTNFFLEIVNAFNDPDFFPKKNMDKFPLKLIIDYLFKAHAFYINIKVPEIKSLIIELLKNTEGETQKAVVLIQRFFNEYAEQLKDHVVREEKEVYPYILQLEKVYESSNLSDVEKFKSTYGFRIDEYARDHEDIEEKLYDIKNLIIKYISPEDSYVICFKLLGQLAHLEEDIYDHTEMENKVLIPRVRLMESYLDKKL